MSRELIADPDKEGLQLIARDDDGRAVGFATVFWTWSTLSAARLGVMNDLFVSPDARGVGRRRRLIAGLRRALPRARRHAARLADGARQPARAERLRPRRRERDDRWLDYSLAVVAGRDQPDS